MAEYAVRLTNDTDTAQRMRLADAIGMFPDALDARNGVRPGGGDVTAVAGAMAVQVSPFSAWVTGGSSDTQGGYGFICDADKTLTLSDGHATLDRVDTIAAVVRDDAYDGSGSTAATLEVIEGTPGAGAPTLPDSCVPLRDVDVPAGLSAGTGGLSSSNLGADRRTYTAALGGILPVSGAAERDALTELYPGLAVYREDTNRVQVHNGAGWDTYVPDLSTDWVRCTMQNGAYDNASNRVQYRKDVSGTVHLTGDVTSAPDNQAFTTLPVGFRPTKDTHFVSIGSNWDLVSGVVKTDGTVTMNGQAEGSGQSVTNTWLNLCFPVD